MADGLYINKWLVERTYANELTTTITKHYELLILHNHCFIKR